MKKHDADLSPVTRSRLHESIVDQIQDKIISGVLAPGEKLPSERELATTFSVNRATVREALKKLEILDLVEICHGDGIYIKNYLESRNLELLKNIIYSEKIINRSILSNLLEFRRIIAPAMAEKASKNRNEKDLQTLKGILESQESTSIMERDISVHNIIARASNNLLYVFILNFFNQLVRDYGFLYFKDEQNIAVSEKFHSDIYIAIKDMDGRRARKIMHEVLVYTEDRIMKQYNGV